MSLLLKALENAAKNREAGAQGTEEPAQAASEGASDLTLEPGMVFTIEPGIYISPNAENVPAEYLGIGVRIEDDILVTASGCENLTADIPKLPDDVERVCRDAR